MPESDYNFFSAPHCATILVFPTDTKRQPHYHSLSYTKLEIANERPGAEHVALRHGLLIH